jgi:hypothetical protein
VTIVTDDVRTWDAESLILRPGRAAEAAAAVCCCWWRWEKSEEAAVAPAGAAAAAAPPWYRRPDRGEELRRRISLASILSIPTPVCCVVLCM